MRRPLIQSGLATLATLMIFAFLDVTLGPTLVASVGASAFIVFAMPHYPQARPRNLLGSYALCSVVGVLCSWLAQAITARTGCAQELAAVAWGAIAVGLATFAMIATDTKHPPAAGLALSYVIAPWTVATVAFALATAALLTVTRLLLKGALQDLV